LFLTFRSKLRVRAIRTTPTRLLAPRLENENHTKDIDFSLSGIGVRREAGYEATMRALRQAPWQGEFDPIEGVILHESMPDLAVAAE